MSALVSDSVNAPLSLTNTMVVDVRISVRIEWNLRKKDFYWSLLVPKSSWSSLILYLNWSLLGANQNEEPDH